MLLSFITDLFLLVDRLEKKNTGTVLPHLQLLQSGKYRKENTPAAGTVSNGSVFCIIYI